MKPILIATILALLGQKVQADFREGSAKSPVRGTEIGPDSEMITTESEDEEESDLYNEHLSEEEEQELRELENLQDEESQTLFDYDNPNEIEN